ncbi:copper chaperone PCu(A)C [Actinomadura luteofluorescens]|uniref:copper chaperone PCu(A)C n=1 Tax=Actinomadura luteofluorescens TaxID=46163 RepID=UPI003D8A4529
MNFAQTARAVLAPAAPVLLASALLAGCSDNPIGTDVSPAAGVAGQVGQVGIRNLFVLGGEGGQTIGQGGSAPVYLTMVNSPSDTESRNASGSAAPRTGTDTLTSVSTPQAASVEIVGGSLQLPAGQDVQVGPAPKIILRGLKQPLQSGQFVPLTLRFQHAGSGSLNAPVQARQGELQSYSPAP